MAAFPGLPTIPFLVLGSGVGYAGYRLRQNAAVDETVRLPRPAPAKDGLETLLKVEPLAVEVGLGLVKLVEGGKIPRCCGASPVFGDRWPRIWVTWSRPFALPTTCS